MSIKRHPIIETITPFLILGIGIAVFIALFMVLAYVLFYGLLLGLVLWAVMAIKNWLFPKSDTEQAINAKSGHKGRTIDYDDIK